MDWEKKFEIVYDKNQNKKEVINMSNDQEKDDLKRFSAEELKVNAFLEKNPKMSYREAVLVVLDKSEPVVKKEFTEEEKQFTEKQEGDLKKVEKYIESHPKIEYREAVKIVLGKDELSNNEKIVEEYIEKRRSQGIEVTYRQAVLACLSESEGSSAEDQEIVNIHSIISDIIYNLSRAEKSSIFKTEDRSKLEQASNLVVEIKESLQKLIDKKGKPEPGKEE
ncbi:hypothetical protein ES705_39913 [subsurface metagenome]